MRALRHMPTRAAHGQGSTHLGGRRKLCEALHIAALIAMHYRMRLNGKAPKTIVVARQFLVIINATIGKELRLLSLEQRGCRW